MSKLLQITKSRVVRMFERLVWVKKVGFEFFYPRMSRGAIVLGHDFPGAAGVRLAVDEFVGCVGVPLIRLTGMQAMMVKLG